MRIIGEECRKIFDIRLILIICAFTFLYYQMFMEITMYPCGGQCTNSPYDIPFTAELVEEMGPTLSLSDWSPLDNKIDELKGEFNEIIAANQVLLEAGITTYDEMQEQEDKFFDMEKEEMTEEEKAIHNEITNLIFYNEESSKIKFELQTADHIKELGPNQCGLSEEEVEQRIGGDDGSEVTDFYKEAMSERLTRDYISLLPMGMLYIIQEDMSYMAILLVICCFVLLVPYQIKEKLRGVAPLYVTTHTGRKIFKKQFVSGVLSCGIVGIIQLLVYLIIYIGKGLSVFWTCPSWSYCSNDYWLNISFGAYMAIYMLFVLLFTLGSTVIAYWIGRIAANYIAGIAISIPLCGFICYGAICLLGHLFQIQLTDRIALWEIIAMAIWILLVGIMLVVRLKRDNKRDILI